MTQPSKTHPALQLNRSLIALAIGTLLTSLPSLAQEVLETVVVTGIKASLQKAQDLKRNADQGVDSIVADDIGKLPDTNVAEALQRIAGVQISRHAGEGNQVLVRGLSQTQTTLNGRAIFTAGKSRGLSFQDVPAELLAGADVYKTPMANQVEGGIGGLIDLRTRRPFDFAGFKAASTVKLTRAELAEKDNVEGSLLLSDRWKLDGGSEFGALVSVAKQKRSYRTDRQELAPPAQLADNSGVYAPTGVYSAYANGERDRTGVTASLQARASSALDFYLDLGRTKLTTLTNYTGLWMTPFWGDNYNSVTDMGQLIPDGAIAAPGKLFQSGKFHGADMNTAGAIGDDYTTDSQLAVGSNWRSGAWTLKSELSYTKSNHQTVYNEMRLDLRPDKASVFFDVSTATPSAYPVLANGGDLTDPRLFNGGFATYFKQINSGSEKVLRLDGERRFEGSLLTKLRAGLRVSDRTATSAEVHTQKSFGTTAQTGPVAGVPAALQSHIGVIPYNNLLSSAGGGKFPTQWMTVTNFDLLRDPTQSMASVGMTVPGLTEAKSFDFSEKTQALYGILDFDSTLLGKPLSGNVGLRYVSTKSDVRYLLVLGSLATPQIESNQDSTWLPSLNIRLDISDKLLARFAASKVVTRPDFNQLTPSGSFNVNDRTGYRGNPALKPLSAEQADVSLEYYMNKSDHVYAAAFFKKVNGFIKDSTSQVEFNGVPYSVRQPSNGDDGRITGLELGYQAFFTSLPGALKGLGVQANYTYVGSSAPGSLGAANKSPLVGLSRNSANLIGMYDYQDFSLRLAYNYRNTYKVGDRNYYAANATQLAQTPVFMKGYGMVDAYASYNITPHLRLAVEASNITGTVRRSYFGVDNLPNGTYAEDRRYALSLHMEL